MKVARHEVPGNRRLSSPSRRERYEMFGAPSVWSRPEKRSKKGGGTLNKMTMLGDKSITPFPMGRLPVCCVSRHFVPGYHHSVPSGQCWS
jgi:hypothetical protein